MSTLGWFVGWLVVGYVTAAISDTLRAQRGTS